MRDNEDDWLERGDDWLERGDDGDGEIESQEKSALEKMNARYVAVVQGGRFRIWTCEHDPQLNRKVWTRMPKSDFESLHANEFIQSGDRQVPIGKAWISWPKRNTAKGLVFDSKLPPNAITGDKLNLWTGWGLTPKAGSWKRLEHVIRKVLCAGNDEHAEYVLNWIAWVIQNPELQAEVAIVFRGAKGLGKGTLGETLVYIFGTHSFVASSREQFSGRFSGHLAGVCFMFADEAVWGGNKEDDGNLKKRITDKIVPFEGKGVDPVMGVNRVSLMMATNADWAIPATQDERRYAVFEPDQAYRTPMDAPASDKRRLYWDAVYAELDNGGREAFLHAMLNRPLGDWHPRTAVPRTEALGEQIMIGLPPVDRWWFERLSEGQFPSADGADIPDWKAEEQRVVSEIVLRDYDDWARHNLSAIERKPMGKQGLITALQKFGWQRGHDKKTGKHRRWICPKLASAREAFSEKVGHNPFKA